MQPSFDLISAVGHAYQFVWHYRRPIARLAIIPAIAGLICYGLILVLDYERNYLIQSVIMLPAFFAEGWMIVYLIRLIFRQSAEEKPDVPVLHADRDMQAGIGVYVLTKYLLFGAVGYLWMNFDETLQNIEGQDPSGAFMGLTVAIMFFMVLIFRFFWLYIPATLNIPFKSYVHHTRGFQVSLQMVGAWLISFVPFSILFSIIGTIIVSPYTSMDEMPIIAKSMVSVLQLVTELAVNIVSTASIAYGIRMLYTRKPPKQDSASDD